MNLPPALESVQTGPLSKLFTTFTLNLPGGLSIAPNILQAILVVILLFLLIYTLGHVRHTYVGWSIKGIIPGIGFGFILALILEGFLLVGGRTALTEVLGWKNAPKPVSQALDAGRDKLISTLGVKDEIPTSQAKEKITAKDLLEAYNLLPDAEKTEFSEKMCRK